MNQELEELRNAIIDYTVREFGELKEVAERDLGHIQPDVPIPVAYTTLGDNQELEIQVTLNVEKKRLESTVRGRVVEEVEYYYFDSINDMIEMFKNIEFDELVRLDELDIDEIIEKDKNAVIDSIELYYYDGFSEPKKINNVDELTIESNYLGDKTDEFMEEYNIEVNQSSLEELQENQFFAKYNIWVNPTKEQLQEFNKSLLLDENEYLQNFEGYEKLYKDRQVNGVFELER